MTEWAYSDFQEHAPVAPSTEINRHPNYDK